MFFCTALFAQQEATYTNPIIPGGYPDPSICRVDSTYYLVNSSFEYFPGLPIHQSIDLVNWQLVGYGLHREEQATGVNNLVNVQSNGGIHAPTIRHHNGTFYIITTNVYHPPGENAKTQFINFIITATDIRGPWSDPHVLEGAPGIDPDIFFDTDGTVWYAGTHSPENPTFPGEGEIWLQELDLKNWKLTGERYFLWRGACGGTWAEGPHIYRRDGRYYLMVAEGGTSFNHAVMIAVSDELRGPYISNARNPILTARHLSYDYWVNSIGHADLIELPDGRWYAVALGIRGDMQRKSNMGRETHLIPVQWEREPFWWKEVKHEWPVASPITGRVEKAYPLPYSDQPQLRNDAFVDNFEHSELNLEWNFRRVPRANTYSLTTRPGYLRLNSSPEIIEERGRCSLMGIRQKETDFEYVAKMEFDVNQENVEAGISLFQKDDNYFTFLIGKKNGQTKLSLMLAEPSAEPIVLKQQALSSYSEKITFKVQASQDRYTFSYSTDDGRSYKKFADAPSQHILSKAYTGAYLGVYITSNGKQATAHADFDWINYRGFPRN
ncbi:MAG: glycoside hydrolase family 43 protein [Calditrichia bacterium]